MTFDPNKIWWWACVHANHTLQLKRWFGDVKDYTEDCKDNPFVEYVIEPFEANTREEAFVIASQKAQTSRAAKLSRQEISEAIDREAPETPLTMPFFLSGELLKECRRQGLKNLKDTGPDYSIIVKIVTPRPRIKCPKCGKEVSVAPKAGAHSHRNRKGEWCEHSHQL